jgi:phage terminase Nu1 subunit (DNA packaging protein)
MKDQLITVNDLAEFTELTPRRIQQLAEQGIIPKPEKGDKYSLLGSIKGLVRYYRDSSGEATKEDRARKTKAEASLAEMEAAKMEGKLCLREDYLSNYADAIAQGAARISRLRSLTNKQKEDVFAALRSVKLPPLPDEKDESEN